VTTSIILSAGRDGQAPYVVDDPSLPAGQIRVDLPVDAAVRPGPAGPPKIGLSVGVGEYPTWHDLRLPGAAFGRAFSQPGDGLPSWTSPAVKGLTSRRITVWASAKDRAKGSHYERLFDGVPADAELIITHHHEPIADGIDPAAYDAEYRMIRSVADGHTNRPRIHIFSVLEAHAMRFKELDWRRYVAAAHVDGVGFDVYLREDLWEAPESAIGMCALAADEFGLARRSLTEFGASTKYPDRGAWIRDGVAAADLAGFESVGLWASKRTFKGKPLDYRPTDQPTLTAFRDLLALNTGATG
jgi:hypothetical protein